ncbi:MAG: hypothetical protein V4689_15320 [Verrucomicrobiota bacterium]
MKAKALYVLMAILAAGVLAFCLMRSHRMPSRGDALVDSMPELGWVRSELKLTDEQFKQVAQLHVDYRPKCVKMCHRISQAHERIEELAKTGRGMTPELDAALREHAAIHLECQQTMLSHIYQTAALLDDRQSAKYLDTMLPYALDFTHSETGNLHGR